ncbi:MAG: hypothetical protein A2406_03165 [Candidatus Komeilibacteria bacterium RIFOXYC1_FULL_37_11]|uniref:Transposase IS200-like domain-containing protein n=1 Tax=Candidatus Komeilibacteria bacterium RIFOXYC1_FULL_37_11 TaxID=1798555 RepID=A0A1G2C284_9BACT|nr:MAG: hypothetical protein A2406_03165 [Candidatus Komeilibacteria bacterium RIFOXYC1_FULL_37_11]
MKYYRQSHVIHNNQYHLVWIPRFRRKVLIPSLAKYLNLKLEEIRKHYPDLVYLERSIQVDHIHLLLVIPPRMSVSSAVNILKSNTSSGLKKKFPFLKKVYADEKGIWSTGYFVATVGINEAIIRKYIKLQEKEDIGQAKLEW